MIQEDFMDLRDAGDGRQKKVVALINVAQLVGHYPVG